MGVQVFVPALMRVAGNLARIFSIFVEVDDFWVKFNIVLSTFLNFSMMCQFFFYPGLEKVGGKEVGKKVEERSSSPSKRISGKKKVKRD